MENFQLYGRYYDLLYKDKDYESDYVAKSLLTHQPRTKSILELGCGSGSHAYFLSKNGFEVTRIE